MAKMGRGGHLKYHPALRYVQIYSREHTNGTPNKSPSNNELQINHHPRCDSFPVYYPDV
jgi:hypothetical protein